MGASHPDEEAAGGATVTLDADAPPTGAPSSPTHAFSNATHAMAVASTEVLPAGKAARAAPRVEVRSPSRATVQLAEHQRVGRFELIRELARGGMGQVFVARDTQLGRKVAIKFLLQDDPTFAARFVIEARATAKCTHENIVTIFEVGEHERLPYMVLELLEGKPLSKVLEAPMPPRTFVELLVPIVRALERAHQHGLVHRDLKPANIFVTDRGAVKVLDFGVAKALGASFEPEVASAESAAGDVEATYMTFSAGGSLVGTIPYMSPEQWGAGDVDETTDLWAVGVMCWRALANVHPAAAGSLKPDKLRARICDATPLPSIATRVPELPPELVRIVDRLLAKPKAERYPSAGALLADLQAFLAPDAARDEEASPYRGLAAFGERDAKFFFGRDGEIRAAVARLAEWPLLAVVGPSGVGKSSFVHAGLVPTLRGMGAWQVHVVRPGRKPLVNLARVVEPDAGDARVAELRAAPGTFGERLRRAAATERRRALLVVDQLEELFTLSDDDADRATFLDALLAAADDPSSPVRVVLSIRADFLDRLAGNPRFLGDLSRGLFFLSPPAREHLRETLERPAELAGYAFEAPRIVDDMLASAERPGALPLLQFAAAKLWDARDRGRKLLTAAAYDAMGGLGGAFVRHADETAAAIPPQQQALLRAVMTRLVTPEGTRAVVDHAELLGLADDPKDVQAVLDQLVQARLVHLQTDDAHATLELVHEVLIAEWPALRRWLEDSHAVRGFVHELQQAAKQWHGRGRPNDLVWRGATAAEALALANRHALDLAATERDFLAAVRAQLARSRRRKVGAVTAVFAVLVLVIAGGAVAFLKISNAEQVAKQKAHDADAEAARAKQALADLQTAEHAKTAAQADAAAKRAQADQAQAAEQQSREELIKTNAELRAKNAEALAASEAARAAQQRAEQLAREAAASAATAKKATADAVAARDRAETLQKAAEARAAKAEAQKGKIATSLKQE